MNQIIQRVGSIWLEIDYVQVGAFSLKPSNTTATAGRSLLIPSPFAIKMALLDLLFSHGGTVLAKTWFSWIRDLEIYINPPQAIAVSRLFRNVQRISKDGTWTQSVQSQEYCLYSDKWQLCFGTRNSEFVPLLTKLAVGIEYLGQRGGFIQCLGNVELRNNPPTSFIDLGRELTINNPAIGMVQRMDDMISTILLEDVSRYSEAQKRPSIRRQYNIILPYHLRSTGTNSRLYERQDEKPNHNT